MPGHNNWFSISLDPPDLVLSPYPFRDLSIQEAADHTVKVIVENYDNLYLGLSGGYDSEFIAVTLLRNNIPFTPLIFKDLYSRESDYAIYFCKQHNLKPIIYEYNVVDPVFVKILSNIVKKLPGKDVLAGINLFLASKAAALGGHLLNGCGVSTADYPYPVPTGDSSEFILTDFYTELLFGDNHPGAFFTYTPEIFYSYSKNIQTNLSIQEAKAVLYNLNFRPKIKPYHVSLVNLNLPEFSFTTFSKGKMENLLETMQPYIKQVC